MPITSETTFWKTNKLLWTVGLTMACMVHAVVAQTNQANRGQTKAERDARLGWWSEAKFGMFIHWGLYSQWGCHYPGTNGALISGHSEHMMLRLKIPLAQYAKIADVFNPTNFNADEWVSIAKNAGMKYLVITAKHHDGFAMYDSASSDYNIVKRTPWQRDPVAELAAACARQGLKFGIYYSLGRDWADPDVPTRNGDRSNTWDYPGETNKVFAKYFERKVKPQVTELLTKYRPAILWFDTPEKISAAQSRELADLIHKLVPDCIINARVGHGLGDYGTPEQDIPAAISTKPWETCMTLNDHWGYFLGDENWKFATTVVQNLADIVSKGGNYLLNVGPTGAGVIPPPSTARLTEVGNWLRVNGEAIYGCGPTPFGPELGTFSNTEKDKNGRAKFIPSWGWRATTKPGKIYVLLFQWPAAGKFELPGLQSKVNKTYLLADHKELKVAQTDAGVSISLPAQAPDTMASVVCLEIADPVAKVVAPK